MAIIAIAEICVDLFMLSAPRHLKLRDLVRTVEQSSDLCYSIGLLLCCNGFNKSKATRARRE